MKVSFFRGLKKRGDFNEINKLNQETTDIKILYTETGALLSVTLNAKCRIRLAIGKVTGDIVEVGLPDSLESVYLFVNDYVDADTIDTACRILCMTKDAILLLIVQMELWLRKRCKLSSQRHLVYCTSEGALYNVINSR